MQRKKGLNVKDSKEPVDRKETLRKKVKQKQDESLKNNMLTDSVSFFYLLYPSNQLLGI